MNSRARSRQITLTVVAFLVAPLVASLSLSIAGSIGGFERDALSILTWGLLLYFPAAGLSLVFAVPVFLALLKLRVVRWWSTMLAGSAVGVFVVFVTNPAGFLAMLKAKPGEVSLWGGIGALCGLVFWLIWRRGQNASSSEHLHVA